MNERLKGSLHHYHQALYGFRKELGEEIKLVDKSYKEFESLDDKEIVELHEQKIEQLIERLNGVKEYFDGCVKPLLKQ